MIRFNRAPTEGWEPFVGKKTTIRIANPHVFCCRNFSRSGWEEGGQPANFVKEQKNCKIVCMGPQNSVLNYAKCNTGFDPSCQTFRYRGPLFQKPGKKVPTIGYITIRLLVKEGIKPEVFGFWGTPGKNGDEGLTHYWEKRNNQSKCHSYIWERDELRKLDEQGKIVWHR